MSWNNYNNNYPPQAGGYGWGNNPNSYYPPNQEVPGSNYPPQGGYGWGNSSYYPPQANPTPGTGTAADFLQGFSNNYGYSEQNRNEPGGLNSSIAAASYLQPILQEFSSSSGASFDLSDACFSARKGCYVKFYQDAHMTEDAPPPVYRDTYGGEQYPDVTNAWEDVFDAMVDAKHFIYITGWSVWTKLRMIRRPRSNKRTNLPKDEMEMTLGDLLKYKSDQGVKVCILVWNEKTSFGSFKEQGLMGTHDEETKAFFANTKVCCSLAYRKLSTVAAPQESRRSSILNALVKRIGTEFVWTHHQKTIILDAPIQNDTKRHIISFLGGLDLTDGRYDTPAHWLFKTLNNEHKDDFYQKNFPLPNKWGPREPWHDVHCVLEGPIANDVLTNFEQRWKLKHITELLDWSKAKEIDKNYSVPYGKWTVQLFRSIDPSAANGISQVEKDIQKAYLNAIRAAKRFLYIENQYFIGSSAGWLRNADIRAYNQIPLEIANVIANKIKAGIPFIAYILVPMFPEGDPHDGTTQQILAWQWNTMSMMYKIIGKSLQKKTNENAALIESRPHPTDYLQFFCAGTRQHFSFTEPNFIPPLPESDPVPFLFFKAQRQPIYIHSKMMIVDDEYIILGSANINDRSMQGDRDSEICIGAYEDGHVNTSRPRGGVHNFRMRLWSEHLHRSEPVFLDPVSIEAVSRVRDLAEHNWNAYVAPRTKLQPMEGHLMRYPMAVTENGDIYAEPVSFPDTTACVAGRVGNIPSEITL